MASQDITYFGADIVFKPGFFFNFKQFEARFSNVRWHAGGNVVAPFLNFNTLFGNFSTQI